MNWLLCALLISVPAHAGGSMAHDVKVIVVHPSAVSKSISRQRQMEKSRVADRKVAIKEGKAAAKADMKARQAADKAYAKKLAKQRKDQK
jgi:predicted nuclease with RNAse H fold